MRHKPLLMLLPGLLLVLSAGAEQPDPAIQLNHLIQKIDLRSSVHQRSESALLDELTAVEQAALEANNQSDYSLELRPRVTDSSAGVALRVYLPERWNKRTLSEQLILAAQSEQLRVAALEWQEVMEVYRNFCAYRMLCRQRELLNAEIAFVKPYLEQADLGVEQHQFSIANRARLYSHHLDLLNQKNKVKLELIDLARSLYRLLGPAAELDSYSRMARLPALTRLNADALIQQALRQRSDYRRFDVDAQALDAAEALAQSKDVFRLKYLQPSYDVDYSGGDNSWALSASFILPWGSQRSEIQVYQQQRLLLSAAQSQQQALIADEIQVLLKTARAYDARIRERMMQTDAVVKQLEADLEDMRKGTLEQVRERLLIRERLLDVALHEAKAEYEKECLAVDLAETLGRLD